MNNERRGHFLCSVNGTAIGVTSGKYPRRREDEGMKETGRKLLPGHFGNVCVLLWRIFESHDVPEILFVLNELRSKSKESRHHAGCWIWVAHVSCSAGIKEPAEAVLL